MTKTKMCMKMKRENRDKLKYCGDFLPVKNIIIHYTLLPRGPSCLSYNILKAVSTSSRAVSKQVAVIGNQH